MLSTYDTTHHGTSRAEARSRVYSTMVRPANTATTTPAPRPPVGQRGGFPHPEEAVLAHVPTDLLIDGEWRTARAGRRLSVENPATGVVLAGVADADSVDCLDALSAAASARWGWAACTPRERARVLRHAADAMRGAMDHLSLILTLEMGKPLAESREEVSFAADYLEWFAEEAVRICGRETRSPDGRAHFSIRRNPVGPSLVITPWNFPLAVPARGLGAALAAGCTVVHRPSAATPLTALALADIFVQAGLPPGVLNVVISSTAEATDPLVCDSRLRKLTFTGSAAVGRHLLSVAAEGVVRTTVELGGCAPVVVFSDADIDDAVEGAFAAKLRNGGAACTAANRFYVQEPLFAEFTERLAARMAGCRLGPGTRAGVGLGPVISDHHRRRLSGLVADAVSRGARVVLPGGAIPGAGHFFAPVVLADVPEQSRCMQEEIFGPIAPVRSFRDEDEVVRLANDRPQGLAAYVFTRDISRAFRVAGALEVGMVGINRGRVSDACAPFGGIKQSGFGSSGGSEGIEDYLVTRCLSIPAEDSR